VAWIVLFHALVFVLFWLTDLSFQQEVNRFLADTTGLHADFISIFLLVAAAVFLWSAARLVLRRNACRAGPAWLFIAIGGFFLVFFYGSFIVLFIKSPVQLARLGQLVQYFRIFVDALLLCLAAWGLRSLLTRPVHRWIKLTAIGAFLVFWLVPVFWTPGAVYRDPLPEKPLLMAHRGASTLAPENTLAAMQVAADVGVYGLETDVTMSYDGTLFLMHDSTLERTTNVAEIFPGREKDSAENFTWAELSQLDAGGWFQGRAYFPGEPIPTLAEVLRIVRENHLRFICDLRIPAADHPFAAEALDLYLAEIQVAGVASQTWVLVSPEEIPIIRAALPEAVLARGLDYGDAPAPEELVVAGYQLVNSEFGLSNRMIRAYNRALWVNIWTVDEPWQYSRLWLAGADSVTSNNVQTFVAMSRPMMAVPYSLYLLLWGLIGAAATVMVTITKR
jgi:glycerophosphoryl diester phosphodiesterase